MERSYEIRKVQVWPAARMMFVLFLVIGILIAVIYSIVFSGLRFLASSFSDSPFGDDFAVFQKLGLVMIPVIAISYAVFGTIGVVIWILIYNIISSVVGGIELALRPKDGEASRPPVMNAGAGDIPQAPGKSPGGY